MLARFWRADEAGVVGGDDELGAVARTELHEQAADVSLRGRQADMQAGSDLGVGQAESDQGQDFAFPLGYLVDRDRRAQDIVHAVIVGPIGQLTASDNLQWNAGTPAQLAVVDGLLKAVGSQPYPACSPNASPCASQPQVTVAAVRFAMLPAATRHAWLAANLAALKAGRIWHGSREPGTGGGCLPRRPWIRGVAR